MLSDIFAQIGISEFTVHVGDRRILKAAAVAAGFKEEDLGQVLISLDKLDKIGVDGILAELKENGFDEDVAKKYLSMYEKNDNSVESFCEGIPSELLPENVKQEMHEIIEGAGAMLPDGVSIMFDPCLGRYDEMIGKFAGMPVPACGFSIGFERIVTILKDNLDKLNIEKTNGTAFLIDKKVSAAERLKVFEKAAAIRAAGGCATILPMKKNVKRQVELLENEGYTEFEKVYGD